MNDACSPVCAVPAAVATSTPSVAAKDPASDASATAGYASMRNATDEDLILTKQQLSEIEDVDLAEAIVQLQLEETALQAALSATARAVQPSLLDFLR